MGKVSTDAELSRSLRRALGNITQAALAAKLLVSRNYISQIEAELKKPSERLRAQMDRLLIESANGDTHSVSTPEEPQVGDEGQAAYGSAEMIEREVRAAFEELLFAAKKDPKRFGWIAEQMKEHLAIPKNWRTLEEINRRAYALHERSKREREERERAQRPRSEEKAS
jgi:transcriptional regulator with XRE-family HTH domain